MNPPSKGPIEGPTKGAKVTRTIGFWSSSLPNMSPVVPPATARNELPVKPLKNRVMMRVSIFLASADGTVQMMNRVQEVMYIGRRP